MSINVSYVKNNNEKCNKCGSLNLVKTPVEDIDSPHKYKKICEDCGYMNGWAAAEKEKQERPNNSLFKRLHKKKNNMYKCSFCGISEEDGLNASAFEVDHIEELGLSGKDVFENTRLLCKYCHQKRQIEISKINRFRKTKESKVA